MLVATPEASSEAIRAATSTSGAPFHRLEPQDRRRLTVTIVGDKIDVSVRALPDVPDSAPLLGEHLLVDNALPLERETRQLLAGHATDEDIAAPLWKAIAGVDHHPRDPNRRHPHACRLLHPLAVSATVNG